MEVDDDWRELLDRATRLAQAIDTMDDLVLRDHFDQHGGNPHLCQSRICRLAAERRCHWRWDRSN